MTREHLCGYDLNLTYPQDGRFPTLGFIKPSFESSKRSSSRSQLRTVAEDAKRAIIKSRVDGTGVSKRDLSMRANGTIDPWYGCGLYGEMIDYAVNFSYPWSEFCPPYYASLRCRIDQGCIMQAPVITTTLALM